MRTFLSSECAPDGAVACELRNTITKLEKMLREQTVGNVTLKVKLGGDSNVVVVIKISLQSTLSELIANVEVSLCTFFTHWNYVFCDAGCIGLQSEML